MANPNPNYPYPYPEPDPPPHAPLLSDEQVRQLAEAKELKGKALIDEGEYKQMKAVILGKAIAS